MSLSSSFEEIIQRRRSNRKFDKNIEVPDDVIKRSLERSILSPNSSNMQLWEFQWIKDPALKEKFTALCLDQNAAKTAKQLVVFVTRKDLWKQRAAWNYTKIKEGISGEPNTAQKRGLDYYGKLMPLAYRSDIFGIFTLIRRLICFFLWAFKNHLCVLVVMQISELLCINLAPLLHKHLCCLLPQKVLNLAQWKASMQFA